MPRTEIKPERRADVTYSAHDGNLWVLPLTTAGISYCRNAMPAGAQRMGMYYLIGEADAPRVIRGLHADGGLVVRQVGSAARKGRGMKTYLVTWEIDIDADSPEAAAQKALRIQRDETSIATVFGVWGEDGIDTTVDLTAIAEGEAS